MAGSFRGTACYNPSRDAPRGRLGVHAVLSVSPSALIGVGDSSVELPWLRLLGGGRSAELAWAIPDRASVWCAGGPAV